jgi:hypothetical protein
LSSTESAFSTYVKIFFVLILAVVFLYVAALTIPGFLVQSSNPTTLSYNLNVGGSVVLYYNAAAHTWPTGTYANCYILGTYSDCLNSGVGATTSYSYLFIILSIVAIMFCAILMLIFAKKAGEI